MKIEIWKEVVGYEGYYSISNKGRLRRDKSWNNRKGKILKNCINNKGYFVSGICRESKPKGVLIHRLVAMAFLGECPKGYEVNHKDGIKENNNIENLEYVTSRDNTIHAIKMKKMPVGEFRKYSKLSHKKAKEIRFLYETKNFNQKDLASIYKVSDALISDVVNFKRWV